MLGVHGFKILTSGHSLSRRHIALQVKDRIKQLFPLIDKNGDHFLDDAELRAWTLGNGAEPHSPCFDAGLNLPAFCSLFS